MTIDENEVLESNASAEPALTTPFQGVDAPTAPATESKPDPEPAVPALQVAPIDEEQPASERDTPPTSDKSDHKDVSSDSDAALDAANKTESHPAPEKPSTTTAATKKFSSSLSVNKKFLEKTGTDVLKTGQSKGAPLMPSRSTTPLSQQSTGARSPGTSPALQQQSLGPRLLSGKISNPSGVPAASLASGGWGRPASQGGPAQQQPNGPKLVSQLDFMAGGGPSAAMGRGGVARGMRGRGGPTPWGRVDAQQAASTSWITSDREFPSVGEASKSKELKARAVAAALAAQEAKDKQSQQLAHDAAEEYKRHLMEDLEAFRGVHLGSNAHWDEMDDDDDLGDVLDFGDGVRYEIPAGEQPEPEPPAEQLQTLQPTEPVNEFDRGEVTSPEQKNGRSLFNDRLGRFEPYGRSTRPTGRDREEPRTAIQRNEGRRQFNAEVLPSKATPATPAWSSRVPPQVSAPTVRPRKGSNDAAPPASARAHAEATPAQVPAPTQPPPEAKPIMSREEMEALHQREMHSAAERAKKRRQEEEAARQAEKERAMQKAKELEARLKAQSEAAKVAATETTSTSTPGSDKHDAPKPTVPTSTSAIVASQPPIQLASTSSRAPLLPQDEVVKSAFAHPSRAKQDLPPRRGETESKHVSTLTSPTSNESEQDKRPSSSRLLSVALPKPPSRAEEASTWRRTAALPPVVKQEKEKVVESVLSRPKQVERDLSPTHADRFATVQESWRRQPTSEAPTPSLLSRASRRLSVEDSERQQSVSSRSDASNKQRTVSFASVPMTESAPEAPRTKLPIESKAKQPSPSLDLAMSRLKALMGVNAQHATPAAPAETQVDSTSAEAPAEPEEEPFVYPTFVDLSHLETDLASDFPSVPPFPTTVWKVYPKVKLAGSTGRHLPPLTNFQSRLAHFTPRQYFDKLPIVSWHMSVHDKQQSNYFREYMLFPRPEPNASIVVKLASTSQSRKNVEPEPLETATSLQDAHDVHEGAHDSVHKQLASISVVLPGTGQQRRVAKSISVKLPKGSRLARTSPAGDLQHQQRSRVDQLMLPPAPSPVTVEDIDELLFEDDGADLSVPSETFVYPLKDQQQQQPTEALRGHRANMSQSSGWAENTDTLKVVKSLWEQPTPLNEQPASAPSVANNSLRDLVDDFPSHMPTMNDLKIDDGNGSEGSHAPNLDKSKRSEDGTLNTSLDKGERQPTGFPSSSEASRAFSPPGDYGLSNGFTNNAPLPGVKSGYQWSGTAGQHVSKHSNHLSGRDAYSNYAMNGSTMHGMNNAIWAAIPQQQPLGFSNRGSPSYGPSSSSPAYGHSPVYSGAPLPFQQGPTPTRMMNASSAPMRQSFSFNSQPQMPPYEGGYIMNYPQQYGMPQHDMGYHALPSQHQNHNKGYQKRSSQGFL